MIHELPILDRRPLHTQTLERCVNGSDLPFSAAACGLRRLSKRRRGSGVLSVSRTRGSGVVVKSKARLQRLAVGRELEVESVRLVQERGVHVAQAMRDLDVPETMLHWWSRSSVRGHRRRHAANNGFD
jgi:hypothetical protein